MVSANKHYLTGILSDGMLISSLPRRRIKAKLGHYTVIGVICEKITFTFYFYTGRLKKCPPYIYFLSTLLLYIQVLQFLFRYQFHKVFLSHLKSFTFYVSYVFTFSSIIFVFFAFETAPLLYADCFHCIEVHCSYYVVVIVNLIAVYARSLYVRMTFIYLFN